HSPSCRTTPVTCWAGRKERDVSENRNAGAVKCNVMVRRLLLLHVPRRQCSGPITGHTMVILKVRNNVVGLLIPGPERIKNLSPVGECLTVLLAALLVGHVPVVCFHPTSSNV